MRQTVSAKWRWWLAGFAWAAGLTLGTVRADVLLLSDHFNTANDNVWTFNNTLAADQAGTLATLDYSLAGWWAGWQIQHGNAGEMILAGWNSGWGANLYASLNHNFASDANTANKPLRIQFVIKVTDASDASNWATIAIGSSQNVFVNDAANKFSSLFRRNGGTQQFASGGMIGDTATYNPNGAWVTLLLSDTAGTGSPFSGSGSVVKFYIDGVLAATHTLAQMTANDGYISFEASYSFGRYDNLAVSLPDPAAITWGAPAAIAGDSDVSTTGVLIYAYNQCNADQTVNGVSFSAGSSTRTLGGGNVTMLGFDGAVTSGVGPGAGGAISAAYSSVLDGFAWKNAGSPASFTLNNLVPGRAYQVQFWVADYRPYPDDREETLTAVNTSGALRYLDSDNTYGIHGSTVTGTFTANGACQTIDLAANASAQMNALQLRLVTPSVFGNGYFDAASASAWDSNVMNWSAASGGPYDKLWWPGSVAHFEGTGGAVTISGYADADGVAFDANGYTLGGGTLRFGQPAGGPHITVNAVSASVDSTLADTGAALIKDGAGALELTGNNTFASGLSINGGALIAARSMLDHGRHTLGFGPLTINSGGTLRSTANWTTASEWTGETVGAITVNPGGTWSVEGLAQTIRNGLYLNGGAVIGTAAHGDWGGLHLKSDVTAAGGVTSTIAVDTAVNWGRTVTVEDGSTLVYSGVLHNQYGTAGAITKSGNGTLTLSGANTYTGTTTVNAGTLRLGASDTLTAANNVLLAGGALDMGASTNTLGTLDVAAASSLALGAGKIGFADCSAVAWTGTLTLEGNLGPQTVRFGNSSSALTLEQLRRIKIGGKSVMLTASGYLVRRGLLVMVL